MKGLNNIFHAKGTQNKAEVALHRSDKIDFKRPLYNDKAFNPVRGNNNYKYI